MNFKNLSRNYEKLWIFYDHLMQNVNYDLWAKYILSLVKEFLPPNPKLLELAGGNCKLANLLKINYPDIIVTDLSKEMLNGDNESVLPKVCCDMSSLPFNSKFDLIYSTFDSINYLTSKKKLLNFFCEIRKLMDENSIFTFDASLESNSLKHVKLAEETGAFKNISYRHKSEYSKRSRIHKNIFHIEVNGNEFFYEAHRQKIYPFDIYFEMLEKAGLYAAACYEAFSYKTAKQGSDRIQFIVKRIY